MFWQKISSSISVYKANKTIDENFLLHQQKFAPTLEQIKKLEIHDFDETKNLKNNLKFYSKNSSILKDKVNIGEEISSTLTDTSNNNLKNYITDYSNNIVFYF